MQVKFTNQPLHYPVDITPADIFTVYMWMYIAFNQVSFTFNGYGTIANID